MDWYDKKTHEQLGAWFNGLFGLFHLGSALLIFAAFGGFGLLFGAIGVATLALPAAVFGAFFFGFGLVLATLVSLPFLVNLAAAVGLAWYPDQTWTTVVALVGALLALPVFPVGTLLCLHTLVVVFWDVLADASARRVASEPSWSPA